MIKFAFPAIAALFVLAACGEAKNPSSEIQSNSAQAAFKTSLRMARITSIEAAAPVNGKVAVSVNYLLSCSEQFAALNNSQGRPISLSNPHIVVGVVAKDNGIACAAADRKESKTFELPAIVGAYGFEKVEGSAVGGAYYPALIKSIDTSAPVNGKITVNVTYYRACNQEFIGLSKFSVFPLSLANPHVGILALVKDKSIACRGATIPVTESFTVDNMVGFYSFLPVEPRK